MIKKNYMISLYKTLIVLKTFPNIAMCYLFIVPNEWLLDKITLKPTMADVSICRTRNN